MNLDEEDVPDQEWVRVAQSGDASAFEILFDRYYAMIHAFAYRLCLGETQADDIAQETFIRAARGLAAFRGEASFKNWLYRIAHHVAMDAARGGSRHHQGQDRLMIAEEIKGQERSPDFTPVHAALQKLPADWREALTLVFFEEMTHAEAARVAGCAETTISWRIFRAKRALRPLLRPGETP